MERPSGRTAAGGFIQRRYFLFIIKDGGVKGNLSGKSLGISFGKKPAGEWV
jgi:hypothetical protein